MAYPLPPKIQQRPKSVKTTRVVTTRSTKVARGGSGHPPAPPRPATRRAPHRRAL